MDDNIEAGIMSTTTNSIDLKKISNAFQTQSKDINTQTSRINGMFEMISSNSDSLMADYLDDKIFNSSSGNLSIKSSLSLDKIKNMDFDEIKKLLDTAKSSEEVEEALQKQKQLYA